MKLTVESCNTIYIGRLQKTLKKQIAKDYPDSTVEETYNHMQRELGGFTANNQKFSYTAIQNKLGGHRWFFKCPKCSSRVSKLFLPPNGSTPDKRYLCKACHNLKNRSAVLGQSRIYQNVYKPMKRMKEIEQKLEKGYLPNNKVQELLDEYDKLEAHMKQCPEYRLYLFRKRRGMEI